MLLLLHAWLKRHEQRCLLVASCKTPSLDPGGRAFGAPALPIHLHPRHLSVTLGSSNP